MSVTVPQVIAGLFHVPQRFETALAELRWTVRQNAGFWKTALLYVDADCETPARLNHMILNIGWKPRA